MTQQLEVSILAAPLAAIDRRSLSQAWYSALGLAREKAVPGTLRRTGSPAGAGVTVRQPQGELGAIDAARARGRASKADIERFASAGITQSDAARQRSLRPAPLARAIEAAFANPRSRARRATFSLHPGGARIVVMLQTNGVRTTLVALCRPEMRAIVSRALGEARLALSARGLEVCANGVRPCS